MNNKEKSCKCQDCGELYKIDLNIPNKIWDKISCGLNLLCGSCIMKRIEIVYNDYDCWDLVKTDQLINSEQNRIIRIIEGHLLIKTIRVALIKAIRSKQ